MINSEEEIWKSLPGIPGVEVSTFGRVRTLDRMVSSENGTRFLKGRVLKQSKNNRGYPMVHIPINGKHITKLVHRLVAQTFITNPDNLPEVNHKDCDRTNSNVENLEFCTPKYNSQYREKFGESLASPVFAISLSTLEVLHFRSQGEAGRVLGVSQGNINMVIKGKRNYAGGYLFKEDDGNGIEIDKDKLNNIADSMPFTGGIFAVNLNTSEVSRFESQIEASRELGINNRNISTVIKGKRNQAGGFWFVNDDGHAVEVVKSKLHDVGGTGLKIHS